MRHSILFFLCFIIAYPASYGCGKLVKGIVTYHPLYHVGARPTPEILAACCSPRPLANHTLYIKENYYSKPLYIINTDSVGMFRLKMRKGNYNLYLENTEDKRKASHFSTEQSDSISWRTNPYFTFHVASDTSIIELTIQERHDPTLPPRP